MTLITYLCRDRLGWNVSELHFSVVQPLELKRSGVLLKVSSISLRDKILEHSTQFLILGFHVAKE